MKTIVLRYLLAFFCIINCVSLVAQQNGKKARLTDKAYPAVFTLTKSEFDNLFLYKINEPVSNKANKYLDKSSLVMNSKTGDMKFLKLKLDYFKNAFLMVQVNGTASTQVFIMSDDKSVFYKGRFEKDKLVMSKCPEDDIVSE